MLLLFLFVKSISMSFVSNVFSRVFLFVLFVNFLLIGNLSAQNIKTINIEDDTLAFAARSIINSTKYCALITVDSVGEVHARMMEVFPLEDDFTIWFGTNAKSRKVGEIQNNPKVTVYYANPDGSGYVTVFGIAQLIDDANEKSRLWKKEWVNYFTDKKDFVLIKLIPQKMEIISYKHGINGDKVTWQAVNYEF